MTAKELLVVAPQISNQDTDKWSLKQMNKKGRNVIFVSLGDEYFMEGISKVDDLVRSRFSQMSGWSEMSS